MTNTTNTRNVKKKNTRNSKNAAMKVRVPGAKKSVDCMKYEIANEVGKRNTRSKAVKRSRTTKKNSSK